MPPKVAVVAESKLLKVYKPSHFDLYWCELSQSHRVRLNEDAKRIKQMRAHKPMRNVPVNFLEMDSFAPIDPNIMAHMFGELAVPVCPVFTSGLLMLLEPYGRTDLRMLTEDLQLLVEEDPEFVSILRDLYVLTDPRGIDHDGAYRMLSKRILPILQQDEKAPHRTTISVENREHAFVVVQKMMSLTDLRRPGITIVPAEPWAIVESSSEVVTRLWQAWLMLRGKYKSNGIARLDSTFTPMHQDLQTIDGQWSRLIDQINEMERRVMSLCNIEQQHWPFLMTSRLRPDHEHLDPYVDQKCNHAARFLVQVEQSYRAALYSNIDAIRTGKAPPIVEKTADATGVADPSMPPDTMGPELPPAAEAAEPKPKSKVTEEQKRAIDQLLAEQIEAATLNENDDPSKPKTSAAEAAIAVVDAINAMADKATAAAAAAAEPNPTATTTEPEKAPTKVGVVDVPPAEVDPANPTPAELAVRGKRIKRLMDYHKTVCVVSLLVQDEVIASCAGADDYSALLQVFGRALAKRVAPTPPAAETTKQ